MKDCILYLIRTSEADVEDLNESLALVEANVLPFCSNVDVLIFHEKSFDQFKGSVRFSSSIRYAEVDFNLPAYSAEISERIPEFFPHPTH